MPGRRTSWVSVAFGLIFTGVGALLLTNGADLSTRLHWAGPIFLVVVALCLIASALGGRSRPVAGAPFVAPSVPVQGPGGSPVGGSAPGAGQPSWRPDAGAQGELDALHGDRDPAPQVPRDDAAPPA